MNFHSQNTSRDWLGFYTILTWPNLWYIRKLSADWDTSSVFHDVNLARKQNVMSVKKILQNKKTTHFNLEILNDWSSTSSAVNENQTYKTAGVSQAEPCKNISSCSFTQSNYVFHVKEVQNRNQILTESLKRGEVEAGSLKTWLTPWLT